MTLPAAVAHSNENNKNTISNLIELPSLETTDAVDRQQKEAFKSLEFVKKNEFVRCQYSHKAIKIHGKGLLMIGLNS